MGQGGEVLGKYTAVRQLPADWLCPPEGEIHWEGQLPPQRVSLCWPLYLCETVKSVCNKLLWKQSLGLVLWRSGQNLQILECHHQKFLICHGVLTDIGLKQYLTALIQRHSYQEDTWSLWNLWHQAIKVQKLIQLNHLFESRKDTSKNTST